MIKTLRQIIHLLHPIEKDYTLKYSRDMRIESEERIQGMKADLNGCSDEWFLTPKSPLDECVPPDEGL